MTLMSAHKQIKTVDMVNRIGAILEKDRRNANHVVVGQTARAICALATIASRRNLHSRAEACAEIAATAIRMALDVEPDAQTTTDLAAFDIGLDFGASDLPRRVTPEMVDAVIADESFHVPPGTSLTIATLTLKNGFTVTGESACADPAAFNAELGRDLAKGKAREKIFGLLAYQICEEQLREKTRRELALSVLAGSAAAAEDTLIKSVLQKAAT